MNRILLQATSKDRIGALRRPCRHGFRFGKLQSKTNRGAGEEMSLTVDFSTKRVVTLALNHRLPAMYHRLEFVEASGLISYATRVTDLDRRAATYVVKILSAKPAVCPWNSRESSSSLSISKRQTDGHRNSADCANEGGSGNPMIAVIQNPKSRNQNRMIPPQVLATADRLIR
jgi:hypothetical protein